MMAHSWFVKASDGERGPFSAAALRKFVQQGKLKPANLVRRDDMSTWVAARQVTGLFDEPSGACEPPSTQVAVTFPIDCAAAQRNPRSAHTPSVSLPREQVDALSKEKDQLLRRRFLYGWSSFAFLLLGIILLPLTAGPNSGSGSSYIPLFIFMVGACLAADYKGRSVFWGLLALAGFVPGIVVAFLQDVGRNRLRELTNTLDKHLAQDDLRNERDRLLAHRKWNQLFSFLVGLPGVMMVGVWWFAWDPTRARTILSVLVLLGVILICVGVAFAANYRGRSACWGLLGILSPIGLLFIPTITDLNKKRLIQLEQLIGDK